MGTKTTNYNWDIGTKGQTPWWDTWGTAWVAVDTELYKRSKDLFMQGKIVYGSELTGGDLILKSTSHATKGKIYFGANVYFDEVTDGFSKILLFDGSSAAPSFGRATTPAVGMFFRGNTLVCQNKQTDHSWPLVIEGQYGGLAVIESATGQVATCIDNEGAYRTCVPIFIDTGMRWTFDPETGIMTSTATGANKVLEGGDLMIISDVWAPCVSVGSLDSAGHATDSLHFLGKLQGSGVAGQYECYPNFQIDQYGNIDIFDSTILESETLIAGALNDSGIWSKTGDFTIGTGQLVSNGGMTDGNPPTGWISYGSPDTFEQSNAAAIGGPPSGYTQTAHVISLSSAYKGFYQTLTFVPDVLDTLSFWYYLVSGQLNIQCGGVDIDATTGSWQYVQINQPSRSGEVNIMIRSNNIAAEFYVTGVSVGLGAKYLHSSGVGTLTQVAANLATPLDGNSWYKLVYTIQDVSGTPIAWIPNTVAQLVRGEVPGYMNRLKMNNYTNKIVMFKTIAAPTDFILNASSATAGDTFILGALSLKKITGGKINTGGNFHAGNIPHYDNNAAAIAAGLAPGDFYKTDADPAVLCIVT